MNKDQQNCEPNIEPNLMNQFHFFNSAEFTRRLEQASPSDMDILLLLDRFAAAKVYG